MKPTEQDKQLIQRMSEGEWTLKGLLGEDPLGIERIERDRARVQSLGLDLAALGRELDTLWQAGGVRCNAPAELSCGVIVVVQEARGSVPCPFDHPGTYPKGVMTVTLQGKELRFSPLSVHLMSTHGFLGGKGSAYRVEPDDLAELAQALDSEKQQQES